MLKTTKTDRNVLCFMQPPALCIHLPIVTEELQTKCFVCRCSELKGVVSWIRFLTEEIFTSTLLQLDLQEFKSTKWSEIHHYEAIDQMLSL